MESSSGNGSGLDLRDVSFRGQLVLERTHALILAVNYLPGGCGCFRDWAWGEEIFEADNKISPGYAETSFPPITVCETRGGGGDIGSFKGVAVEKNPTELIRTTHMAARWYIPPDGLSLSYCRNRISAYAYGESVEDAGFPYRSSVVRR